MKQFLQLFLILLIPVAGWCQDAGESRNIMRDRPGGQRWAILIGVDDYIQVKDLQYCGADMRALRARLVASGFPEQQVKLLHDDADEKRFLPFKANIEQQIDLVLSLAGKDDMVVLAFSGHGVHLQGGSYLCPSEARLDAPETLVSLEKIYSQMKKSAAALKVMVVDACRNDPQVDGQRALNESTKSFANAIGRDRLPEGLILLNSCTAGEVSWEDDKFGHGVFIHFLLEGLDGKADTDKSGIVTLGELSRYAGLHTKVHVADRFNNSQRPFLRGDLTVEALEFSFGSIDGRANRPAMPARPTVPIAEGTKAGEIRNFNKELNLEMVWCPPGKFTMGSPQGEAGRDDDDEDQAEIALAKGFWLGRTEITQGQWKAVMQTEPWAGKEAVIVGDRVAASYISWDDADAFCRKLTDQARQAETLAADWAYGLPEEASWEYACRAGQPTAYGYGNDPGRLGDYAWYQANTLQAGRPSVQEVGLKTPNAWGLHDLHGNVAEWCSNPFSEAYQPTIQLTVPHEETKRTLRGGAWNMTAALCRSAARDAFFPASGTKSFGFRIVLAPTK